MSHEGEVHVSSFGFSALILGCLLGLTGLTYWVSTMHLGHWDTPIALGIAVTKATLVILFFMHVKYSSSLTKMYAAVGFAFLVFLFAFTFGDFLTRPATTGWMKAPGFTIENKAFDAAGQK